MKTSLALIIVGAICVSSCSKALRENSLSRFDGDYDADVWRAVQAGNVFRDINEGYSVRLTVTSSSTIKAKLMRGNDVISRKKLKGKDNEDGHFSMKSKTFLLPIPFFIVYNHVKSDMILTENNNLLVDYCAKKFVLLFVLPISKSDCSSMEYIKIR